MVWGKRKQGLNWLKSNEERVRITQVGIPTGENTRLPKVCKVSRKGRAPYFASIKFPDFERKLELEFINFAIFFLVLNMLL